LLRSVAKRIVLICGIMFLALYPIGITHSQNPLQKDSSMVS